MTEITISICLSLLLIELQYYPSDGYMVTVAKISIGLQEETFKETHSNCQTYKVGHKLEACLDFSFPNIQSIKYNKIA